MNQITNLRNHFTISECGKTCKFHEQLERKVYTTISDAFSRLDGVWSKKADAFLFEYDAREEIEEIFATGVLPKRNPLQLHPTPRSQVLDMIEASENVKRHLHSTTRNVRMLEPSIGRCGIADVVRELHPNVEIVGVELDSINVKLAQAKGYDVTHADFLQFPVPETEEEKFDVVIMNPPFMSRDFIKHIRHAQSMLKKDGALVSVIPFEWMKSANKGFELEFLTEASRCSSQLNVDYPAGTYENTNCVTAIVELVSAKAYKAMIPATKDYWLHVNAIEIENDSKFQSEFNKTSCPIAKINTLKNELQRKLKQEKTPCVLEWVDELLELIADEDEDYTLVVENKQTTKPVEEVKAAKKSTDITGFAKIEAAMADIKDVLEKIDAATTTTQDKHQPASQAQRLEVLPVVQQQRASVQTKIIDTGSFGFIVVAAA
jgi:predicted RNA methylase